MERLRILCVAEKPSVAVSVASVLSGGRHTTRSQQSVDTHEFEAPFLGRGRALFLVTSVRGHLFSTDFEEQYQSWDLDPARLFDAPTRKVPTSAAVVAHLQREARGCGQLVLFMDSDREGEHICFEVMHVVLPVLQRPHRGERQVWRARFSAVTEAAIRGAMASLREPNEHEAAAVDARQDRRRRR